MRSMKKLIVLLVVATMVFGMVSGAFAATANTTAFSDVSADSDAATAFSVLGALGVYTGDSGLGGPARPDETITRAEFAAVVVRLLGKDGVAKALASFVPQFSDAQAIPTWSWGYVNVAKSMGIINGYPDGSFKANNLVTHAEAIAMLTRAIGNDAAVKGTWPINYVVYGADQNITFGVDVVADLPATRGEVALMAYNSLFVDKYNPTAQTANADGYVPNTALFNGIGYEGVVASVTSTEITLSGQSALTLADQVQLVGVDSLNALQGLDVKVYTDSAGKVVAIERVTTASFVAGTINAVDSANNVIQLNDGSKYVVATQTATVNDTVVDSTYYWTALQSLQAVPGHTVRLTLDKYGKVAAVWGFGYDQYDKVLDKVTPALDVTQQDKITVSNQDLVVDTATLLLNGDAATLNDYQAAIDAFKSANYTQNPGVEYATKPVNGVFGAGAVVKVNVYTETASGKVTSKGSDANGAYVKLDDNGTVQQVYLDTSLPLSSLAVGTSYTLLLKPNGKAIADIKGTTGDVYVAIVRSFSQYTDSTGAAKTAVTLEKADGTTVDVTYNGTITPTVNGFYAVVLSGSTLQKQPVALFDSVTDSGTLPDGTAYTVTATGPEALNKATSTYIQLATSGVKPYAANVFIYDTNGETSAPYTANALKKLAKTDLKGDGSETVTAVTVNGEVQLLIRQ